jgi:hypothetical protein
MKTEAFIFFAPSAVVYEINILAYSIRAINKERFAAFRGPFLVPI